MYEGPGAASPSVFPCGSNLLMVLPAARQHHAAIAECRLR